MNRMECIRRAYNVPAKRGGKLIYTDFDGAEIYCTIRSATLSNRLVVSVDDANIISRKRRFRLHPSWHIKYLSDKL